MYRLTIAALILPQVAGYFARLHFLMPVIDKPSFMLRYEKLMANKHDTVLARNEAAFTALVFSVFACAARLIDDPRLVAGDNLDDGGMGMVYYERYVGPSYSISRALTACNQRFDTTLHQPRNHSGRSCPMSHFDVLLLVLRQLSPASLASCRTGCADGTGSWSPCQF